MVSYAFRRLLLAVPTVIVISLVVFTLLDLAPGDPTSQVPLTVPAEVRENIRESMGFNDPFLVRWGNWTRLMLVNEPIHAFETVTNTCFGDCEERERIISWSSRSPAMDTIYQRLPQTLWVLGLALVLGVLMAIPSEPCRPTDSTPGSTISGPS
jgi:peptide/nickel transport system permease protein